jgi:hypothetical protein
MGRQTPDEFHLVFEVPLYRRDRQDHSRNAEPDAHGGKRWIGASIRGCSENIQRIAHGGFQGFLRSRVKKERYGDGRAQAKAKCRKRNGA